jgi:heme A synthase
MILKLLRITLLFLAPFLLYAVWIILARRFAKTKGPNWNDAPMTWLTVAGLVLVIAGFVATGLMTGEDATGTYVPPRVIDGVVLPGHVVP